jgi:hypothetical protein
MSRLIELATEIADNTKILAEHLASKNVDTPSFDIDGLTELPISPADKDAYAARSSIISATKELHDLTVGPKESLRHLAWNVCIVSSSKDISYQE